MWMAGPKGKVLVLVMSMTDDVDNETIAAAVAVSSYRKYHAVIIVNCVLL